MWRMSMSSVPCGIGKRAGGIDTSTFDTSTYRTTCGRSRLQDGRQDGSGIDKGLSRCPICGYSRKGNRDILARPTAAEFSTVKITRGHANQNDRNVHIDKLY